MKLANKVAIITGAAAGIGLGYAKAFVKYGARVIMADRDDDKGQAAAAQLSQSGVCEFVHCDVTQEEDLRQVVTSTVDHHGQLDCFISNAGWHPPSLSIDQISVADFESLLRLNLTSTFMGCKFAVEHLQATHGSIVITASEVALIGQASAVSYVATKAGQVGFMKALALDLAASGIRVNAICPAGVRTPLLDEWAASEFANPEEGIAAVDAIHPLGRMATIEEMGEVCAFLASSEASFITGQAICPDGGAALGYRG